MIAPRALAEKGLSPGRRSRVALALVAVLACILAYGVALHGPLFFDDVPNLLDNDRVQIDGRLFDQWRVAALSSGAGTLLRPFAMWTFALNHVVVGAFSPFSLKVVNLLLHLGCGALLYGFAMAALLAPALRSQQLAVAQCRVVALIAAAIWLLHPIHVSTVLYAVQRMTQLSALFTLAGLLIFTRYRLRWAASGATAGEVLAALLWLVLSGVFAVFSKENGALLPWLIAVVEVTLFRGAWCGRSRQGLLWLGWFVFFLPLLLVTLVLIASPEMLSGRFLGREFTLEERLLTQGRVLWQYLSWLAIPNVLDMGFFHDDIPISHSLGSPYTTALSLIAWAAVIAAALLWHKRYPLFAFALLFYLVAHSMESTVLPLEMVYEHRNYLPSVGLAILAAVGVFRGAARFDGLRLRVAVGGILGAMAVLLAVRTHTWSDEMTLARFNVINHPGSARANFFYANALFKRFEQSRALGLSEDEQRGLAVISRQYFERMHRLDERDFAALVMLYQLDTMHFPGLAEQHDWLGAMEELAKTRRLQSSDITALTALVAFSGSPSGAAGRSRLGAMLAQLVESNPGNTKLLGLHYRFILALGRDHKPKLLPSLERAARVNSESPEAAAFLAQFHGADNLAGTYEAIREWMRRDQYRRELPVIRDIFEN